uniref:Fibrinogen beta chain n=1 Tax=Mola mola TaxID=94237 RepID=A0A3Q3WCI7_MOLML
MRTLLVLYLCAYAAWASDDLEYDDYGSVSVPQNHCQLGARGHRPVLKGRETYHHNRRVPAPIKDSSNKYHSRPATGREEKPTRPEAVEQLDLGGCTHASQEMGLLCPNGCELKTTLLKQERNVRMTISQLKPEVRDLSRSSNTIHDRVSSMSQSLRERQRVTDENSRVVTQYTNQVEEQHAYIKETVDTIFPSNIRVLQGVLDNIRSKIEKLEKAIAAQTVDCREPCTTKCPIPVVSGKECEDVYRRGGKDSQMYLIQPDQSTLPFKVFCDQTGHSGGWLLIQSRLDGSVDFGRRWDDYRRGFGNIAFRTQKGYCETPGEYWLGVDRISQLTKMGPTEVLIEMQDWTGDKVHAKYRHFTVQSEQTNYVLAVEGYSGNAGNCFLDGSLELFGENRTMTIHNGMMFSTYDRDNDNWTPGDPSKQCSKEDGGGWWYNRCHSANPNGRYYIGGSYTKQMAKHGTDDGVVWMNWKGSWYSLKAISMKIKPYFISR